MRRLLLALTPLVLVGHSIADEPPTPYRLVSPKPIGIIATGLNGRGDLVGFEWVEEKERPGVLAQVPFFARGKVQTTLPLLQGYTSTFPAAVSDDGLVVGRVSKPTRPGVPVNLRNQAFVWEAGTGISGLGTLPGDRASIACGVTRDGTRISGYAIGDARLRACVWDRDGVQWRGKALPHVGQLGTTVVPISDDGKFVAGVDGGVPCLWSLGAEGIWTREVIGEGGSLTPRAVNNSGTVAGLSFDRDGTNHAVVWTRATGGRRLELPRGYVHSEANAVNNAGVVVGMVDGPHGSDVGPDAFVFERGRIRLLTECGPHFSSATALNDRGEIAGVLEEDEDEEGAVKAPKP